MFIHSSTPPERSFVNMFNALSLPFTKRQYDLMPDGEEPANLQPSFRKLDLD
jgi:hypothetical protein